MALSKLTDIRKSLSVEVEDLQVNGITTFTGSVSIGGTLTYQDVTNVDSVGIITAQAGIVVTNAGINVTGGSLTVDAFSNTANNYLSLRNGYVPSASGGMGFMSADHSGSNADGVAIYGHDGISLYTAQVEKVRITSSGLVGIGTDTPGTHLHVNSGTYNGVATFESTDAYAHLLIKDNSTHANGTYFGVEGNNFRFITHDGSTSAERVRITSNGNILVGKTTDSGKGVEIYASNNAAIRIQNSSTGQGAGDGLLIEESGNTPLIWNYENSDMRFGTNNLERLQLKANGDVYLNPTVGSTAVNSGAIRRFSAGLDYWSGTAGSANAIKYAIHSQSDDNMYGLGISNSLLEIQAQANIAFFAGSAGSGTGRRVERLRIDSSGRVIIGDTDTDNANTSADDLVVSTAGISGITIKSGSSSDGNLFFSDGNSAAQQYAGYVQYSHSDLELRFGANAAMRALLYDKAGNATSHSVLQVGGSKSNNHYNSISNASITFGGGNDIDNYFIGVRRENYGGDYTKLDLRWHTGIRMGAQQGYGGIRFYDNEDLGAVKFSIMGGADAVTCHTTFRPAASNTYNLGNSSYRWGTLYASNATNTSDRNEKNTITESDLGLDFICKLKPVSYKWNQLVDREGEHLDTKTHYGLISQDVEETVIATGKTLDDFGAIDKPEGDDPMGLSYHEFISPLIKAIQEQQEQIKILQEKIAALEGS